MASLTVCLDTNVYISAIAFGGKPLKILEHAIVRDFRLVTASHILQEVQRNLVKKLELNRIYVERFIADISLVSSIYVPTGRIKLVKHEPDNLVLEVALLGGCDVLVTGDKKHLLPLKLVDDTTIESPSKFLERLKLAMNE